MSELTKELHKPVVKSFQRRRVVVTEIDEIWGADLVDMSFTKEKNKPYVFILTVIDCFSKYAWAIPLKNKSADSIVEAFETLFRERIPQKVWVDQGSEFYNSKVERLFKKHNIEMYSTFGDHKSAIVERFNRTLKNNMFKYFTENDTRKWINVLPVLIKTYNETIHRTIKMTPIEASKKENEDEVLLNINDVKPIKKTKPKFSTNDYVRLSVKKNTFEKGYTPNWTHEVFKIVEVLETKPNTYKIVEYDGTEVEGSFYEQELQKTNAKDVFKLDAVLKKRTRNKKVEHLVHWYGWPKKYDEWISDERLKELL